MNGQYEMEGRLITVPVNGAGDYLLSSPDYLININTELETVQETDGKTHFVIKNMTFEAQPLKGLQFEFKNLFNGQKDLAEAVRKYAEENWKEVCLLMQDPIWSASIVKIVSNFNKYLSLVTYEDIMLD
ncbi:circadian clock-controlled protein daywake-like [Vanessa cardui]|uniref:circadian clock-controlled protein daywake-like n=1 Tax=Vanessa cardui TaxID=171605 RepID=UPI001F140669|nr:circadian clock-controlled protein daywake-like [Vanessa cardui]